MTLDKFIVEGWARARTKNLIETDLPLPFPFVPPSITQEGLFRTLYYWDTYFTNVGLIADGHVDWAKENVYAMRTAGIMVGMDGDNFAPTATCTTEQTVLAALRLTK